MRVFALDVWGAAEWESLGGHTHAGAIRETLWHVRQGDVVRSCEEDTSDVRYYGPEGSEIPGAYTPRVECGWHGLSGFGRSLGTPPLSKVCLFFGSVLMWCALVGAWPGIILAVGVLAHEYAHLAVAYGYGVRNLSHPTFIVIGAMVRIDFSCISHRQSGWVSLSGPLSGIPLALLLGLCGIIWNEPLLYLLAGASAYFNLLNLLPIPMPLDGSRVLVSAANASNTMGKITVASVVGFAWLNLSVAWVLVPLGIMLGLGLGAALSSSPDEPTPADETAIAEARLPESDDWRDSPARWLIPAYLSAVLVLLGLATTFLGQDGVVDTMYDIGFILLGFGS